MPRKVGRRPEDVAKLAESLQAQWEPAEGIEPWLQRRWVRLQRMVQKERWTWANIADAMSQAGITYRSGKPWQAHILATKVSEIRRAQRIEADREELARRRALDVAPQFQAAIPEAPEPVHQPDIAPPRPVEDTPPRRTFRTVTLPGDAQVTPPQPAEPAEEPASAPATKHDADAVYRRLFGNRKD